MRGFGVGVNKNPATRLKKPPVRGTPVLPFTEKEWNALLRALDKYPKKNSFGHDNRAHLKAFVLMLRYSGLRIGDLTKLEKARISKDGFLTLYTSKAGVQVRHPLPKHLLKALKDVGNDRYFFWSGEGKLKSAVGDWQRSIRRLMKDAKIDVHPHMFRHTLAVELLSKGIGMGDVAAILGQFRGSVPETLRLQGVNSAEGFGSSAEENWRNSG
jgi:integrase